MLYARTINVSAPNFTQPTSRFEIIQRRIMKTFYFDHAAATPLSKTVFAAMQPYFSDKFYNPSAIYLAAQETKQAITAAREHVSEILGARSSEIIFTAGGTEANNLAINGIMQRFPKANCIVSAIEHESILAPASKYTCKIVPVLSDGRVNMEALNRLIDDQTVLISIMYANNEVGTIQPLAKIAQIVKQVRVERIKKGNKTPLYFHTDACQAANYLHLLIHTLGVDLMTLNGGKIYGPKQSGVLYVQTGVLLQPQILGGGQERGLRSGTENVPFTLGFAAALQETNALRETESRRLKELQQYFISSLVKKVPKVVINGSKDKRLPNNIHVTFPGVDNERLMMELDERSVMVATGSACSASSDEPSHVLKAIGLSEKEARSSIRITFGRATNKAAIDSLLSHLVALT